MKSIKWILLALFFIPSLAYGQEIVTKKTATGKAKSLFDRGMKYVFNGVDDKAVCDFEKVIKIEPTFIDAHIQLAAIHYDRKKYTEAEKGFENVLALSTDYQPKVFYTLAVSESKQNKFQEAIGHFEQYINSNPKSEKLKAKAEKYIDKVKFASQALKNPVPFEPKSVGNNINSPNAEYLPALTADGETMIYTKRIRGQEDFYISVKKDGEWKLGIPMLDINDPKNNEGAQSISADGRFLVFTACGRRDGYGSCDLYYSEVRDGRWTKPANIGNTINTRGWESQPSISGNGNALFFASNREGGKGDKDIWVSYRQANGKWGKPENLGDNVNTSGMDETPFIHPDMQTLYFMSNGHPGMGSTDIFFSRKDVNGKWGKPQNMGYPINTEAHEGALIVSLDGKTAYFATDRKYDADEGVSVAENAAKGKETDIYYFDLYEEARPKPVTYVKATVSDAETGKKLVANVELIELGSQKSYATSITDKDGEFLICLPMNQNYALNVNKQKYLFHSENFALETAKNATKPYLLDIKLQPIPDAVLADTPTKPATNTTTINTPVPPKAKPIILKNVFFETGSAALQSTSVAELTRLKELLEEHTNMRIQINGHTDNVGADSNNMTLSDQRARAVYDWLVQKGIAASRLQSKGFGETQPIDANDTEDGRQRNRRTEFVVL